MGKRNVIRSPHELTALAMMCTLLGQPEIPFLQAFNQPADGSKANDKVMAQSKVHRSQKYLLAAFLGFWKGAV